MNVILAIDTASSAFALAVRTADGGVRTLVRECGRDHSQMLIPAIADVLGDDGGELGGIVVVRGPGAYAGIRVGLATASALALGRAIPRAGVTTFEAIARAAGAGHWLGIHPAGRGTFATQQILDGVPDGSLASATTEELGLSAIPLAGEGAGALGGKEVGPESRVLSALEIGEERLREGFYATPDAVYLREPNITTPRRPPAPPTI